MRTKSFWNDTEIAIASHIIQSLIQLDISATDIGCISLCKFKFYACNRSFFFFLMKINSQGTSG